MIKPALPLLETVQFKKFRTHSIENIPLMTDPRVHANISSFALPLRCDVTSAQFKRRLSSCRELPCNPTVLKFDSLKMRLKYFNCLYWVWMAFWLKTTSFFFPHPLHPNVRTLEDYCVCGQFPYSCRYLCNRRKFHSPDIIQLLFPSRPHTITSCTTVQGTCSTTYSHKSMKVKEGFH